MSEVTFAKSFLATLDKRSIKLPADHVSDPRKYESQTPYIIPKQTHPFPRKERPLSSQEAKSTTIAATLKSMRSGPEVKLTNITLDTTIHDLKSHYAQQSNQPQDKIKILLNKKPAADLKTLKELGVNGDVELSVMILGGTTPALEKSQPAALSGEAASDKMEIDSTGPAPESEKAQAEAEATRTAVDTAAGILNTEEFWTDLKSFLAQRLRDQSEGEALAKVFKDAWSKR